MLISFDATPAMQGAGVGRYSRSLLRALLEAEGDERYVLLASRDARAILASFPGERVARRAVLPVSQHVAEILWQRLRLPVAAEWYTGRVDVFHAPNFLLPPLRAAKGVLTVHDLSYLKLPRYAHPALAGYLRRTVPRSIARADVVLADSRNTAEDVAETFGMSHDRLCVVYPGVDGSYQPVPDPGERERLDTAYGLDRPYLLAVGTIEPRKNYPGMIEATKLLRQRGVFDGELAIVGATGWLAEESLRAAAAAGAAVRLLGRVEEADLPALYRQAEALVYASHYEGFGLPPLEAMACATPVVVARTSSLPEVVGEAGLYSGTDADSIAAAVAEVLSSQRLRDSLRMAGPAQASRFTWQGAAAQVRRVYREMA